MIRQRLYNAVNTVCPTYWVGQHQGECISKYAVIKLQNQSSSINNTIAGWQYVDVMVYVPNTSVSDIDSTLMSIQTQLINIGLEPTGEMTPDYLDTEKNAIMRSIKFRVPKQII